MNSIQFEENIGQTLGGLILAVGMGLGAVGSAEAGAVTGNFDPPFGPTLPGWNYSGTFSLDFSDEWTRASYGGYQQVVDVDHRRLVLGDFFQTRTLFSSVCLFQVASICIAANSSNVQSSVVSITYNRNTGLLTDWVTTTDFGIQVLSELNGINFGAIPGGPRTFEFSWNSLLAGPTLTCAGCVVGSGPVNASLDGLKVTYQQQTDTPWPVEQPDGSYLYPPAELVGSVTSTYRDVAGELIRSTVVTLPGAAQNTVPEPGSMALVLAALMGAGWMRRRQA